MVLSLITLCARQVVADFSSPPCWLASVPRELYRPLLDAALVRCRPLAIGELVRRWPERTLQLRGRRRRREAPPTRLCVQALLLAVVRGLGDQRCALEVLDLCGLQCEDGHVADSMGGWSLTVALCSTVLQAKAGATGCPRRERDRKRLSEIKGQRGHVAKRERGVEVKCGAVTGSDSQGSSGPERSQWEAEQVKGVRRKMEAARDGQSEVEEVEAEVEVRLRVRADLFVNARSWERVRVALATDGPMRVHCRHLRVEELPAPSISTLLSLLPAHSLLGLDIRYSSLGVSGLALLLPSLVRFPSLDSLRLHYCNLDVRREVPGQEQALRDMALGLGVLSSLRQLSLTALRLPGHLRLLLGALCHPLEVLELPYLSLTPADLSYLSCSIHASFLRCLDLSENRLEEAALPSLCRLLSQASGSLMHLSLCGCSLSDKLQEALLPTLGRCRALRTLRLALNPLSQAGLLALVRLASSMHSLCLLLHPRPLEEYEPGLPALPSSSQLLDWPLTEELQVREALRLELDEELCKSGRWDLRLTSDLLNYSTLLEEQEQAPDS